MQAKVLNILSLALARPPARFPPHPACSGYPQLCFCTLLVLFALISSDLEHRLWLSYDTGWGWDCIEGVWTKTAASEDLFTSRASEEESVSRFLFIYFILFIFGAVIHGCRAHGCGAETKKNAAGMSGHLPVCEGPRLAPPAPPPISHPHHVSWPLRVPSGRASSSVSRGWGEAVWFFCFTPVASCLFHGSISADFIFPLNSMPPPQASFWILSLPPLWVAVGEGLLVAILASALRLSE